VADLVDEETGETVEVPIPLVIPDVATVAALDDPKLLG
jgi:hypothetical protein